MTANDNVRYRVNVPQELLLKSSAVLLYLLGLLLTFTGIGAIATVIIDITADILYFIWFLFLGANFLSGRKEAKLFVLIGNGVVSLIPFLDGVYPSLPIEVWCMVHIMKKEDEERAAKGAARAERDARARAAAISAARTAQARAAEQQEAA